MLGEPGRAAPPDARKYMRVMGLDVRSVSAFRMCLAMTVLANMYVRSGDISAMYTDEGFLSRHVLRNESPNTWSSDLWSLHFMSGTLGFQVFMFLLQGALAVLLLLGWKARAVALACWVLEVSLENRNTMILEGADQLLRMMLLWACFMPIGTCFTLEGLLRGEWWVWTPTVEKKDKLAPGHREMEILSAGTIAYTVQMFAVYFFSGLMKTGPQWGTDGTAGHLALRMDSFVTPFGAAMLDYIPAGVLELGTRYTFYLEKYGGFLLFVPSVHLRLMFVTLIFLFHALNGLMLSVGLFPVVGACSLVPLVPSVSWYYLDVILSVPKGRGRGKETGTRPPVIPADPKPLRLVSKVVCGGLLGYVLLYNMGCVSSFGVRFIDSGWTGRVLRIHQCWDMFAPQPATHDGYLVMQGVTEPAPGSGKEAGLANLFQFAQVDDGGAGLSAKAMARYEIDWNHEENMFRKPADVAGSFQSSRWQKYFTRITTNADAVQRKHLASYLCRKWNRGATFSHRLMGVSVTYVAHTNVPYQPAPYHRTVLFSATCTDTGAAVEAKPSTARDLAAHAGLLASKAHDKVALDAVVAKESAAEPAHPWNNRQPAATKVQAAAATKGAAATSTAEGAATSTMGQAANSEPVDHVRRGRNPH